MGPFGSEVARSTAGVKGVRKFLDKIIKLSSNLTPVTSPSFPLPASQDISYQINPLQGQRDDHKTIANGEVGIGREPSLTGEGGAAG